jgi:hypothetical protein
MKTDAAGRKARRKGYLVARLDEIAPVPCPCGMPRRAFVDPVNTMATLHLVDISEDVRAHYHEKLTEIDYVLEGEGHIELKVLNVPVPAFDAEDEHFDGEGT